MQTQRPKKYLQCHVYRRRFDKKYGLDVVLCYADLDLVSTKDAKDAIDRNIPWKNPLKWVTVAIDPDKNKMFALMREIQSTGSVFQAMRNLGVPMLLTGSKVDGASGKHTLRPGSTEHGLNSTTMDRLSK